MRRSTIAGVKLRGTLTLGAAAERLSKQLRGAVSTARAFERWCATGAPCRPLEAQQQSEKGERLPKEEDSDLQREQIQRLDGFISAGL